MDIGLEIDYMFSYHSFNNNLTIATAHEDKRALGLALLLAVIAHVILLIYVKLPPSHKTWSPTIFDVQLSHVHESPVKAEPSDQVKGGDNHVYKEQPIHSATPKTDQYKKIAIQHTTIVDEQMKTQPIEELKPINPKAPKQAISYGELLESAQKIAKEDVKNMPQPKEDAVLLTDRAFSPRLAQALVKKGNVQGVTQYADGMLKVVTSSGTEYCLSPSPQLIKGAFEPDPIPMTCP